MNKQSNIIKFTLTKSALQTALGKYFALILNNGTHDLAAISAKMQDGRPVIEDADVKLTLAALIDAVIEEVVVNHNRVDLGAFSVELAISGSVQSMDGALTDENEIYLLLTPSDALRNEVAKIIPSRASSDKVKVKMENVEDVATHQKLIRGQNEFVITGTGLSASLEGEALQLCNLDDTEAAAVTVLEKEGHGERIYAKLAASVSSGTYQLKLLSRGYYTPDAEPQMYTKKVTVEAVPAPPPTVRIDKVVSQDGTDDVINFFSGVAHVEGENLALLPGDTVKLRGKLASTGEDDEHLFDDFAYDAETGKIDITVGDGELSFAGSTWNLGLGADVVVTSRGGVAGSEPQVVTRHVTLAGA